MTQINQGVAAIAENLFMKATIDDPYPLYGRLREAGPVLWLEAHNCYAVARHAEVRAVYDDWQTFSSAQGTGITNYSKKAPWRAPAIVLEADPPLHTRGRKVFTRALSPKSIRDLREPFKAEAEKLVDLALEKGEIDGMDDLARAFTLKVFPDAVGMGPGDRGRFLEYGDLQLHSFMPPTWLEHDPFERLKEIDKWVSDSCGREAMARPGFGTTIYEAVDAGEITDTEARNLVRSFISAGVDNSITSFGNGLWCYATYPDQWQKLRNDPSLLRNSYDEILRFMGPLQFNFRTTSRVTEFADATLAENEKVCVFLASANHDERFWDEPERFNIERRTNGHMGFGAGLHGCVGQVLARLEGEVLFEALLKKVRAFEFTDQPTRRYINVVQSFQTIPMRLIPN